VGLAVASGMHGDVANREGSEACNREVTDKESALRDKNVQSIEAAAWQNSQPSNSPAIVLTESEVGGQLTVRCF
jgi:hypothetical protein